MIYIIPNHIPKITPNTPPDKVADGIRKQGGGLGNLAYFCWKALIQDGALKGRGHIQPGKHQPQENAAILRGEGNRVLPEELGFVSNLDENGEKKGFAPERERAVVNAYLRAGLLANDKTEIARKKYMSEAEAEAEKYLEAQRFNTTAINVLSRPISEYELKGKQNEQGKDLDVFLNLADLLKDSHLEAENDLNMALEMINNQDSLSECIKFCKEHQVTLTLFSKNPEQLNELLNQDSSSQDLKVKELSKFLEESLNGLKEQSAHLTQIADIKKDLEALPTYLDNLQSALKKLETTANAQPNHGLINDFIQFCKSNKDSLVFASNEPEKLNNILETLEALTPQDLTRDSTRDLFEEAKLFLEESQQNFPKKEHILQQTGNHLLSVLPKDFSFAPNIVLFLSEKKSEVEGIEDIPVIDIIKRLSLSEEDQERFEVAYAKDIQSGLDNHYQTYWDRYGLLCFTEINGWKISGKTKRTRELHKKYALKGPDGKAYEHPAEELSKKSEKNQLEIFMESFAFELKRSDGRVSKVVLDTPHFTPEEYAKLRYFMHQAYDMDKATEFSDEIKKINVEIANIESEKKTSKISKPEVELKLQGLKERKKEIRSNMIDNCQKPLSDEKISDLMSEFIQEFVDTLYNGKIVNCELHGLRVDGKYLANLQMENSVFVDCYLTNCIMTSCEMNRCAFIGGSFENSEMMGVSVDDTKFYGTSFYGTNRAEMMCRGNWGFERGLRPDSTKYSPLETYRKYRRKYNLIQALDFFVDNKFGAGIAWDGIKTIFKLKRGKYCDMRESYAPGSNMFTILNDAYANNQPMDAHRRIRGCFFSPDQDQCRKELFPPDAVSEQDERNAATFRVYFKYYRKRIYKNKDSWPYISSYNLHKSLAITASSEDMSQQIRLFDKNKIAVMRVTKDDGFGQSDSRIVFKCFTYSRDPKFGHANGQRLPSKDHEINSFATVEDRERARLMSDWEDVDIKDYALFMHLLTRDEEAFRWAQRSRIAYGAIAGLQYLLDKSPAQRIHEYLSVVRTNSTNNAGPLKSYQDRYRRYNSKAARKVNGLEIAKLDLMADFTDGTVALNEFKVQEDARRAAEVIRGYKGGGVHA